MFTRSVLTVLVLASVAGCHRRTFENAHARDEVIVTSTTVITNADVPTTDTETSAAPAPSPVAATTNASEPVPQAPSEADRTAANLGMRDAGESATAPPAASPVLPAPAPMADEETPARRVGPARAADRNTWAGDSVSRP